MGWGGSSKKMTSLSVDALVEMAPKKSEGWFSKSEKPVGREFLRKRRDDMHVALKAEKKAEKEALSAEPMEGPPPADPDFDDGKDINMPGRVEEAAAGAPVVGSKGVKTRTLIMDELKHVVTRDEDLTKKCATFETNAGSKLREVKKPEKTSISALDGFLVPGARIGENLRKLSNMICHMDERMKNLASFLNKGILIEVIPQEYKIVVETGEMNPRCKLPPKIQMIDPSKRGTATKGLVAQILKEQVIVIDKSRYAELGDDAKAWMETVQARVRILFEAMIMKQDMYCEVKKCFGTTIPDALCVGTYNTTASTVSQEFVNKAGWFANKAKDTKVTITYVEMVERRGRTAECRKQLAVDKKTGAAWMRKISKILPVSFTMVEKARKKLELAQFKSYKEEHKREKKNDKSRCANMLTPARMKALWNFKSLQLTQHHKKFLLALPKHYKAALAKAKKDYFQQLKSKESKEKIKALGHKMSEYPFPEKDEYLIYAKLHDQLFKSMVLDKVDKLVHKFGNKKYDKVTAEGGGGSLDETMLRPLNPGEQKYFAKLYKDDEKAWKKELTKQTKAMGKDFSKKKKPEKKQIEADLTAKHKEEFEETVIKPAKHDLMSGDSVLNVKKMVLVPNPEKGKREEERQAKAAVYANINNLQEQLFFNSSFFNKWQEVLVEQAKLEEEEKGFEGPELEQLIHDAKGQFWDVNKDKFAKAFDKEKNKWVKTESKWRATQTELTGKDLSNKIKEITEELQKEVAEQKDKYMSRQQAVVTPPAHFVIEKRVERLDDIVCAMQLDLFSKLAVPAQDIPFLEKQYADIQKKGIEYVKSKAKTEATEYKETLDKAALKKFKIKDKEAELLAAKMADFEPIFEQAKGRLKAKVFEHKIDLFSVATDRPKTSTLWKGKAGWNKMFKKYEKYFGKEFRKATPMEKQTMAWFRTYALAEDVSNRRAEIREQRFKGKDKSRMNKLHKLQKKADKEVQDQAEFVKKAVSELNLAVFSCQGALSSQYMGGGLLTGLIAFKHALWEWGKQKSGLDSKGQMGFKVQTDWSQLKKMKSPVVGIRSSFLEKCGIGKEEPVEEIADEDIDADIEDSMSDEEKAAAIAAAKNKAKAQKAMNKYNAEKSAMGFMQEGIEKMCDLLFSANGLIRGICVMMLSMFMIVKDIMTVINKSVSIFPKVVSGVIIFTIINDIANQYTNFLESIQASLSSNDPNAKFEGTGFLTQLKAATKKLPGRLLRGIRSILCMPSDVSHFAKLCKGFVITIAGALMYKDVPIKGNVPQLTSGEDKDEVRVEELLPEEQSEEAAAAETGGAAVTASDDFKKADSAGDKMSAEADKENAAEEKALLAGEGGDDDEPGEKDAAEEEEEDDGLDADAAAMAAEKEEPEEPADPDDTDGGADMTDGEALAIDTDATDGEPDVEDAPEVEEVLDDAEPEEEEVDVELPEVPIGLSGGLAAVVGPLKSEDELRAEIMKELEQEAISA